MTARLHACAEVVAKAKVIVETHDYLTSEDLSSLLLGSPSGQQMARMRSHGTILGMRFARRGFLYPAHQVDRAQGRVNPVAARVNRMLLTSRSVPEVVIWWRTEGPGRIAPSDLLISGQGVDPQLLDSFVLSSMADGDA
jgi:hypothetical protein